MQLAGIIIFYKPVINGCCNYAHYPKPCSCYYSNEIIGYQYGYIDEEGNVIAECKYDYASDFINGIGVLKEGSTISAINTKGETI